MIASQLDDYLEQMMMAASDALNFVAGQQKGDFLADKRTQQAVVMSFIIMGEAATKIMEKYPEYVVAHPEILWKSVRGMRNRIAHGYFETNFEIVWETVQTALPELRAKLVGLCHKKQG